MKILWVVQHLGKHCLEAGVVDDAGNGRRVKYSWMQKENPDIPPDNWAADVEASLKTETKSRSIVDLFHKR